MDWNIIYLPINDVQENVSQKNVRRENPIKIDFYHGFPGGGGGGGGDGDERNKRTNININSD